MKRRFEGTDGERRLIAALQNCAVIEHNDALARRIVELGEVVSFEPGATIMSQGGEDNDIYFIVSGEVDVLVNGRPVAVRRAGDSIGEMAILEPSEPRSATVKVRAEAVALKLTEPDFQQVADEFPTVWKAVARIAADRLRQRAALISLPNNRPYLFLGCSSESLRIAEEIQLGLKHSDLETIAWTNGVFGPSGVPIDDLMRVVNEADFAVFVFSPDDKTTSRGDEYDAPRDNVVFELGLFMGRLDRRRTFIVKEQRTDVKIPTDLLGITPLTYVYRDGSSLQAAVAPVCTEIRKVVQTLGVR